jgi:hypothetical protein
MVVSAGCSMTCGGRRWIPDGASNDGTTSFAAGDDDGPSGCVGAHGCSCGGSFGGGGGVRFRRWRATYLRVGSGRGRQEGVSS